MPRIVRPAQLLTTASDDIIEDHASSTAGASLATQDLDNPEEVADKKLLIPTPAIRPAETSKHKIVPTLPTVAPPELCGPEELWREVLPEWVNGAEGYLISNKGRLKHGEHLIDPMKSSSNEDGNYKTSRINDKTVYWSRLAWLAFVDPHADANRTVIRYANHLTDELGFLDCSLKNLYTKPSSAWPIPDKFKRGEFDPPEFFMHPIYGAYMTNQWYKVRGYQFSKGKLEIKEFDHYHIMILRNEPIPYLIRSLYGSTKFKAIHGGRGTNCDPNVSLVHEDGKSYKYQLSHVILPSAFRSVPPLEHIDHIDDNSKNMSIENLQYLSGRDNCRKAQAKSCLVNRKGIPLTMICPNGQKFDYISVGHAARDLRRFTGSTSGQKTIEGKIRACLLGRMNHYLTYKFIKHNQTEIPGEIWQSWPKDQRIMVSNRGRVKNVFGHISKPNTNRLNKYSRIRGVGVHNLVYETFHGEITAGQIVLHDEFAPLTPEGHYRNWAEDLRLGSPRENNKEYHDRGRLMARKARTMLALSVQE